MTSQVKESAAKANAGKRDASKKLDYQPDPANILEVRNLSKHFNIKTGLFSSLPLKAVDDVSFFIRHKETLGLVGESGCGKTTVGRALMWLYPPTAGDVYFNGSLISEKNVRSLRRNMQMVFQDPYSSLNPRMTVEDIIGESLSIHKIFKTKKEQRERVYDLMRLVGLNKEHATRYAHEFSGGQRQRIGIARALAINPKFIVCDESVSALDVSIQAQILNMFKDLQDQLKFELSFIAQILCNLYEGLSRSCTLAKWLSRQRRMRSTAILSIPTPNRSSPPSPFPIPGRPGRVTGLYLKEMFRALCMCRADAPFERAALTQPSSVHWKHPPLRIEAANILSPAGIVR